MRVLDVNDFKSLANPNTGLVPLKIVKSFAPYEPNTIAGFPPETAIQHIESGHCELLDESAQAEISDKIRRERIKNPPKVAVTSDDLASLVDDDPSKVNIPQNWRELHGLKRIALAKQLAGDYVVPAGTKPADYADTIIASEEKRRGEAATTA